MAIKTKEINPGLNLYNKWPLNVSCPAKKVEPDLVFVGGQQPIDGEGNIVGLGNVQEQARCALTNFKKCVELAGGSMDDVIEIQSVHTDVRHIPAVLEVGKEFFKRNKPTWSALATSGVYKKTADISISGKAMLNAKTRDINPGLEWFEKPPWDVAVPCKVANDLVIMGQICSLDEKGKVVAPGDILAQTRYVTKKIAQCMKEAGGTSENLVNLLLYNREQRAQVYLFEPFYNSVVKDRRRGIINAEKLAATSITMPGLFHPDILLQAHVYGVLGDKEKQPLGEWVTWNRVYPWTMLPHALKVGRYVFISGIVIFDKFFFGLNPETDIPSVKSQARWSLQELQRIMVGIGATMDNVVLLQPYSHPAWFEPILEVHHEFFHNEKPVWNGIGAGALFSTYLLCEHYGIAIVDEDSYQSANE